MKHFLNLLNCMNFKQLIKQQTHNRGHNLNLVIAYCVCILFNITCFIQKENPLITLRKGYISSEVVANFLNVLKQTRVQTL